MAEASRNAGAVATAPLLGPDEPKPFEVANRAGSSPVFLTCEHAGRRIPRALGDLGVPGHEMDRHIAYDIGAEDLARRLSARLDAPLVLQPYSRLVVDCNRPPESPQCVPEISDGTAIPANRGISPLAHRQRVEDIHTPFHGTVAGLLDARQTAGQPALLVAVHSFTAELAARPEPRPWHVGLLYNRDDRLARHLMAGLEVHASSYLSTFNEPYTVEDDSDFTIPVHGEKRGIPHVLLEVRNDELATPAGRETWTGILAVVIDHVLANQEGLL
ncbi:N-formylglutamate amidohydrolase [Rhodobium gokarnense]|uniref:N-formylglutamate amidohydrolase n=1 Tax=Rhodobium gokarnense TaxID=364296 RepID=A0ABT3HAR9_9HYPH|nr:N-formylglutamate amidohydrolase [Rhodobium gokarnense]MCW2307493.1 putative N-formylglutamate amidohydrolase [Rhodobium gokarnense]